MTKTEQWPDLSLDQTLALKTAAEPLAQHSGGVFGTETIERFLHVRPLRDEIERRVRRLLAELNVTPVR